MNFREKLPLSVQEKFSDLLLILCVGEAALLSYSLVYVLRKPLTAVTFDGMELSGMGYKIATSTIQIFGYMVSKLVGIKLIPELRRKGCLKFILVSILVAKPSLVLFGCLPRPFDVLALLFNGLSFGCMWGVIFSPFEGRRMMDLFASLFGLGIAISNNTARSIGLFVVGTLHVNEFRMSALIGAVALPLLTGLGYILDHLPKPITGDKALRVERVILNKQQHWNLFRSFTPILTLLFFTNLLLTVLQDVKGDFLAEIIDVNVAGLSPWVFVKVDGIITLITLAIFTTLVVMRSHIKALSVLLTPAIAGVITLNTMAFNHRILQLSPPVWLFIQSPCLYFSYLSFQTIFFDRLIACSRIKGDISFFITMVNSIGCTGTVVVLVVKECSNPNLNQLEFYDTMAETVGIVYTFAFTLTVVYLTQKYREGKQGEIRRNESCSVPSLASY